jgi:hypothetical protein
MAGDPLDKAYDAAFAGNGVAALTAISALNFDSLSDKHRDQARRMQRGLQDPPTLDQALPKQSARLLLAYQHYWQRSLAIPERQADVRRELRSSLSALLTPIDDRSQALDALAEEAKRAIEAEGLHALTGITGPFYELMIWETQTQERFAVSLHDQTQEVNVVFLENFSSLGWLGFATCARYSTAGWAGKQELFALKEKYKLRDESFTVSYLAHEARHFADCKKFPQLESPELEYRAKLTELSRANATQQSLFERFARQSALDRSNPHALANYWVIAHIRAALSHDSSLEETESTTWQTSNADAIRVAALSLLEKNDKYLEPKRTATQFLALAKNESGPSVFSP